MEISPSELKELMDLLGAARARSPAGAQVVGRIGTGGKQRKVSQREMALKIIEYLREKFPYPGGFNLEQVDSAVQEKFNRGPSTARRAVRRAMRQNLLKKKDGRYVWVFENGLYGTETKVLG